MLYAQASPRSIGGLSLFSSSRMLTAADAAAFYSEEGVIRSAASQLQNAGFQVLQVSPTTINIAGPPSLYEEVFNTRLVTDERAVIKAGAREDTATFVDSVETDMPGLISTANSSLNEVLEGVAIEEPVYFMAGESPFAPTRKYWHLRVPGDVSAACNADKAHRAGITGRGVKVVMVDSGWYAHPYFSRRGYKFSPVVLGPAAANANDDESGHGTGESANAFANAPGIDFTMVKINFVNSTGAFNTAVGLSPHIITNSWGSSVQFGPLSAANTALGAAIASAVAAGIIVVFSAGNGHWGFPGQHPDVISAGGVHMAEDMSLRASDYASGFASNVYPGRNCPDVSGLVGMKPGASYIMLPIRSGCEIDTGRAGGTWPPQDETTATDGWGAFSGTSAAAPQIAGVCALIKEACGRLTPVQVRDILKATAVDVTVGTNALGNAAGPGYDLGTGAGLVDANKAVLSAKLKCRPIIGPVVGPVVVGPVQPPVVGPPVVRPIQPPVAGPVQPPIAAPVVLPPPGPASAMPAEDGLTAEEAAQLEQAIMESGEDLGL
ncbi:MAG: S8 family serine peptidase [Acidimicrobiales bacterium]